ncbi:MAG: hypothetical protein WBA17_10890 [Saprospiraceae bacterium]
MIRFFWGLPYRSRPCVARYSLGRYASALPAVGHHSGSLGRLPAWNSAQTTRFRPLAVVTGLLLLVGLLSLPSCGDPGTPEERYAEALAEGQTTTEREDALFKGLSFGMTRQQFFDHCWKMNKNGTFKNGTGAQVLYEMSELQRPARLYFYPDFSDDDRIVAMDMELIYEDWAPWNKEAQSDKLLADVVSVFSEWYGEQGFIALPKQKVGTVAVRVDANRRTALWRMDNSRVRGRITDLSALPAEPLIPVVPVANEAMSKK